MALQPQNIYDDSAFFSAYGTLPRSQQGLSAAPEWPDLRHMVLHDRLPVSDSTDSTLALEGHRILDLGCGYGWFARWARDNGAAYVKAVDISHKMICQAMQFETNNPKGSSRSHLNSTSIGEINFEVGNIESITFSDNNREGGSYNIVYSSLAFHYVEDLARLYREIHSCLEKRGKLVFSVEHPISSAPIHPGPDWKSLEDEGGQEQKIWPLNCYSDEGWRVTSWLGVDGIRKYHRTVETYVKLLLENGFTLTGFKDWAPSIEDVAKHPEWTDERHRPYFLLICAEKK
ncbi:S-adenosyl-L-methionine-dependent methyltransferase [Aspergillus cavernicola]|uniref:S-adenosyl-L-methionine-dependent methyltransferase n=1 Tax=Aspergillus cavernicola TaxID=176166 RepID=A0ABR4IHH9_9EURO